MNVIETNKQGSAPFSQESGSGTIRILHGERCWFSIGASQAVCIPSVDFAIQCKFADFTIFGNGDKVALIRS